jgi:hypothetical protein
MQSILLNLFFYFNDSQVIAANGALVGAVTVPP